MPYIQAKSEMLIRAKPNVVFNAFAHKNQICRFWLDDASGDVGPNANVEWHFMVPGAKETVHVVTFVQEQCRECKFLVAESALIPGTVAR